MSGIQAIPAYRGAIGIARETSGYNTPAAPTGFLGHYTQSDIRPLLTTALDKTIKATRGLATGEWPAGASGIGTIVGLMQTVDESRLLYAVTGDETTLAKTLTTLDAALNATTLHVTNAPLPTTQLPYRIVVNPGIWNDNQIVTAQTGGTLTLQAPGLSQFTPAGTPVNIPNNIRADIAPGTNTANLGYYAPVGIAIILTDHSTGATAQNIITAIQPDGGGYWTATFLSNFTVALTAAGPTTTDNYTLHRYTMRNGPLDSWTLNVYDGNRTDVYPGARCAQLEIFAPGGGHGLITHRSQWASQPPLLNQTYYAASYEDSGPLVGWQLACSINGVPNPNIASAHITIKQGATPDHTLLNSQAPRNVVTGQLEISATLTFTPTDETEWDLPGTNLGTPGTQPQVAIGAILPYDGETYIPSSLCLIMSQCSLTKPIKTIAAHDGLVTVTLTATGINNSTDAGLPDGNGYLAPAPGILAMTNDQASSF